MKKKGFTLIELLVVIAIIGLLSTLAVVSLNGARQKANDAKRVSDLKAIQTAMEMYKNNTEDATTLSTSSLATFIQGGFPAPVDDNYKYYICASSTNYLVAATTQTNQASSSPVTGSLSTYGVSGNCIYINKNGTQAPQVQTGISCGNSHYCIGTR